MHHGEKKINILCLTTNHTHAQTPTRSILGILRLDLTALCWVNKDLDMGCLLALQRITPRALLSHCTPGNAFIGLTHVIFEIHI